MRKYTLDAQTLKQQDDDMRERLYDWLKAEGSPSINTIVKIELYPRKREVVYHLAVGVDEVKMCINTIPFRMPLKNKPNWVDMCTMSEV